VARLEFTQPVRGFQIIHTKEEMNMSWIITILVGALCGWLASIIMKTDAQQGAVANIVIGIVGSLLAQLLFSNYLHIGGSTAGMALDVWSILWGVIGAAILILLLKALRVLR
jgi:uncharacterized membrane protein YeaQ/YmgE (transglycosylase-associated protein family)